MKFDEAKKDLYFKDFITKNEIVSTGFNDVEKMFDFSLKLFKKIFPSMNFGYADYMEYHLFPSKKFTLLLTKENF